MAVRTPIAANQKPQPKDKKTTLPNSKNLIYSAKNYDVNAVRKIIKQVNVKVVVESFDEFEDISYVLFIMMAARDSKVGQLFEFSSIDIKEKILQKATDEQLKIIFQDMWTDDLADLVLDFPSYHKRILLNTDREQRQRIKEINQYDDDDAGFIMNTDQHVLNINMSLKEALDAIKEFSKDDEVHSIYFVVDDDGTFIGQIDLKDFIFINDRSTTLKTVLKENVITILPTDSLDEVIEIFNKYDREAVPVINNENKYLGYILDNDILIAMQDVSTDDIYHMYGITNLDNTYVQSTVMQIVKSRIFWLIIIMLTSTFTSVVIDLFQDWGDVVTAGVSTFMLVPALFVILGTSGASGSQTTASLIRAVTIGEITNKNYFKTLFKEFKVSLVIATILAIINFIRLFLFFLALPPDLSAVKSEHSEIEFNLVVSAAASAALFIGIVLAKFLGLLIPIIALKLDKDPSLVAIPFLNITIDVVITTVVYIIGIACIILLL